MRSIESRRMMFCEALAGLVGLRAVSGRNSSTGVYATSVRDEDEEQQHEGHQSGHEACRRDVHVPLLAVVRGVEHVEAALAEQSAPPGPHGLYRFHRSESFALNLTKIVHAARTAKFFFPEPPFSGPCFLLRAGIPCRDYFPNRKVCRSRYFRYLCLTYYESTFKQ